MLDLAQSLNAPLAIIEKRRPSNEEKVETLNIIGDVKGKIALTFDDEKRERKGLAAAIAKHAINHDVAKCRVLVYVLTPDTAGEVREEIAQTVGDSAEIDDEIRGLFAALGG